MVLILASECFLTTLISIGACDENLLEINVLVMITSPKIIRYLVSEGFKGKAQTIFEDEKLHDSIEDVAKDGQVPFISIL